MTVETKYVGGTQNNTGLWVNPSYLLNASDALCGYKAVIYDGGYYRIDLINFGWSIPAGSTLNSLKFGFKSRVGNAYNTLDALSCWFKAPSISIELAAGKVLLAPACSDVSVRESDDILPTLEAFGEDVLNNLNNGVYYLQLEFFKYSSNDGLLSRAQCDCAWMTLDYTPPVAAQPIMNGLTFVQIFTRKLLWDLSGKAKRFKPRCPNLLVGEKIR